MFSPKLETKPERDVATHVTRATRAAGRLHFLMQKQKQKRRTLGCEPAKLPHPQLKSLSAKIFPRRKELLVAVGGMDLGKMVKRINVPLCPYLSETPSPAWGIKISKRIKTKFKSSNNKSSTFKLRRKVC